MLNKFLFLLTFFIFLQGCATNDIVIRKIKVTNFEEKKNNCMEGKEISKTCRGFRYYMSKDKFIEFSNLAYNFGDGVKYGLLVSHNDYKEIKILNDVKVKVNDNFFIIKMEKIHYLEAHDAVFIEYPWFKLPEYEDYYGDFSLFFGDIKIDGDKYTIPEIVFGWEKYNDQQGYWKKYIKLNPSNENFSQSYENKLGKYYKVMK